MEACPKLKIFPPSPSWFFFLIGFLICAVVAGKAHGQRVVGRKAADKYFRSQPKTLPEKKSAPSVNTSSNESEGLAGHNESSKQIKREETPQFSDHFMAVYVGGLFGGNSFAWGDTGKVKEPGSFVAGVSYRIGEWYEFTDLLIRLEVVSYALPEGDATKISFGTGIQFPEASSGFPLYFGAGIGAGIFAKQINDESVLSLDYQLLLGARMFNVFGNTGLFIESGLKNHFLLLSDGQYNGFFVSLGSVFTF